MTMIRRWVVSNCLQPMRSGQLRQQNCAGIRTDGEFFYFDLRPFDAREGRVTEVIGDVYPTPAWRATNH